MNGIFIVDLTKVRQCKVSAEERTWKPSPDCSGYVILQKGL